MRAPGAHLRERWKIRNAVLTTTSMGGHTETWSTVAEVPGRKVPDLTSERFSADKLHIPDIFHVWLDGRYTTIQRQHQLQDLDGNNYHIVGLAKHGDFVRVTCQEVESSA